jgi:glycosyltransferase involved in cell wall biosynthesis
MNHGGVESWLMALLRHADRAEIAMDFLVHTSRPAVHDSEIAALEGTVISCPTIPRASYVRNFNRALRLHGPYDVLHSHVHYFSGVTTTLARRRGVRLRIAHSHSNTTVPEADTGPVRAAYRMLMRRGMFSSATHLLAASAPAACALFGTDWRREARARVVYCGVDFAPFAEVDPTAARESVRREFDIPRDALVLGHVGSFHTPKNHAFLGEVGACALRREPRVCVFCVGAGPLREPFRAQLEHAGVRAIFAGHRSDIPRLLRAMDVFVFPSIYEGLPLALVEAQAAGLPGVVSDQVTREVDVVPGLLRWLPLSSGAERWASEVLEAAHIASPLRLPSAGLDAMRCSPFSVEASFASMRSIYHA